MALLLTPMNVPAPAPNYLDILTGLVSQEDRAVVRADRPQLDAVFKAPHGETEQQAWLRSKYLRAWAGARGLVLTDAVTEVHPERIRVWGSSAVDIEARVGERFEYYYRDQPKTPLWFGLGVDHDFTLTKVGDQWLIQSDDCFPAADWNAVPAGEMPQVRRPVSREQARLKATAYADRFCGAAPGCGNDHHYNRGYANYNDAGGDCTAYVSQILHAAGFTETPAWNYDDATKTSSDAWSNANGLTNFLLRSHRATLIARGSLDALRQPTAKYPEGALAVLQVGDLITDFRHGSMQHSGLVVAFDPRGYPLVDAHSSDRYHVPWDLNWDTDTVFYLWHIDYSHASGSKSPGGTEPSEAAAIESTRH